MAVAPDIRNYTVGKGVPYFKKKGEGAFVALGNLTTFEFTPSVTKLDHFSTMTGIKSKDRSVTVQVEGSLKIVMEEFVSRNLAIALGAVEDVDSTGRQVLNILQAGAVEGEIKFTQTNQVGPRWEWHFPSVTFTPDGAISAISDEWGNFGATGEVTADQAGSFGTLTRLGGEDDDPSSVT